MKLKKGVLKYSSTQRYLGVLVNDEGNLKKDVSQFIHEKRGNVLIKFTNFCSNNFLAPINVKLNVLDSCVVSSLIYAAETWSTYGTEVEVVY